MADMDKKNLLLEILSDICILFMIFMTIGLPVILITVMNIKNEVFQIIDENMTIYYSLGLLIAELIILAIFYFIIKSIFKGKRLVNIFKIFIFIWLFIYGIFINYNLVEYINVKYAASDANICTIYTPILHKRINEKDDYKFFSKALFYKLTLQSWLPNNNEFEITVDEKTFKKFEVSDIAVIDVKKGFLGIDFINNTEKMSKISKSEFNINAKFPMNKDEAIKNLKNEE